MTVATRVWRRSLDARGTWDLTRVLNSGRARKRRYQHLCSLLELRPDDTVLDVGCGAGRSFEDFNHENEIVGLDIDPIQRIFQENFRFVHGTAASMDYFRDQQFDAVVCIGVLERVVPYRRLQQAASEIRRVGKAYAVVVPAVVSAIDPHSQLPLGQFLPRNFRRMTKRWDLLETQTESRALDVEDESLIYLRAKEWNSLFPDAHVVGYRHLAMGLLRNLIIYHREDS